MDLEAKVTGGVFDMLLVPVTVNDKDIRRCYTFAVQAWEFRAINTSAASLGNPAN